MNLGGQSDAAAVTKNYDVLADKSLVCRTYSFEKKFIYEAERYIFRLNGLEIVLFRVNLSKIAEFPLRAPCQFP